MKIYVFMLIIAILVLLGTLSYAVFHYNKYRKIKEIYRDKDILKDYRIKTARSLFYLVPNINSRNYKKNKTLLNEAGWSISVERFFIMKWILAIVTFVLLVFIQTTNVVEELRTVETDINYTRMIIDERVPESADNLAKEKVMFDLAYDNVNRNQQLTNPENKDIYIDYIQGLINKSGIKLDESLSSAAKRIYNKLVKVQLLEYGFKSYFLIIVLSYIGFMVPTFLGLLKNKLIESKKEWELLNLINVYSIYGRLPPYDIKIVLENMIVAADIYKHALEELYDDIKLNRGEKAFDNILSKTNNETFIELIEIMKLGASSTGMLNSVEEADEMADTKLKWFEVEDIKRREIKSRIAMVPVGIMILLAMAYFSLGMTQLSNPMSMVLNK